MSSLWQATGPTIALDQPGDRDGFDVAALVALVAGSVLYLTLRSRGRLSAPLLLFQGVFYLGYVGYVLTRI